MTFIVLQVEVAVMTQTVLVVHDAALAPPAALVAALNGAMLEASLAPPRTQAKVSLQACCPMNVLRAFVGHHKLPALRVNDALLINSPCIFEGAHPLATALACADWRGAAADLAASLSGRAHWCLRVGVSQVRLSGLSGAMLAEDCIACTAGASSHGKGHLKVPASVGHLTCISPEI